MIFLVSCLLDEYMISLLRLILDLVLYWKEVLINVLILDIGLFVCKIFIK